MHTCISICTIVTVIAPVNGTTTPYITTYSQPACIGTVVSSSYSSAGYGNGVSPCVTSNETYTSYPSALPGYTYQLTCYGGYHIGADWQLIIYNQSQSCTTGSGTA